MRRQQKDAAYLLLSADALDIENTLRLISQNSLSSGGTAPTVEILTPTK
jgi:hypothetical protein